MTAARTRAGYSYKLFEIKLTVTADASTFTARALPTPEADAVRADVMANNNRETEAKALIANVLRDDPKSARAHETMGFIALHANDEAGARKWFGEAVELGTDSPFAYYFYATSTLQSGATDKDDSVEASLRQAIKLNDTYAPPYEALGRLYAMRHRNLEEASELMRKAALMEPQEISIRLNMANVYMERDMPDAAIHVLEAAQTVAKDKQDKEILAERLASYKEFEDRKAAYTTANATHEGGMPRAAGEAGRNEPARNEPAVDTTTTVTLPGSSTPVQAFVRKDASADLPSVPATAPHRTAHGVVRNVHCAYPSMLTLELEQPGKTLALFSSDMYKVAYSTVGYVTHDAIDPCTAFAGMKAKIDYAEVNEKNMAGEILAVELSK